MFYDYSLSKNSWMKLNDAHFIVENDDELSLTICRSTRITDSDSPYAAALTDHVIFCDTDGGAIEVDLPVGDDGYHYKIINCGSSGNDLDVDPYDDESLFGAAAGVPSTVTDGNSIDIHFNSTEGWW